MVNPWILAGFIIRVTTLMTILVIVADFVITVAMNGRRNGPTLFQTRR